MAKPTPPPTDEADVHTAIALLSGVTFVMATFYLLNHKDKNIREYSWNIVSTTLATFVGILICVSFNAAVSHYLVSPADSKKMSLPIQRTFITFWCMILWIALLEVVLAKVSGAIGEPRRDDIEGMKRDMRAWATFLGIIASFSTLHFWGSVQHAISAGFGFGLYLVTPLAVCLAMRIFFHTIAAIRRKTNMDDDGSEDECEKVWVDETSKVEDSIMGIVLSHLVMQALRFKITGMRPLPMGQDPPGLVITWETSLHLGLCTLVFIVLSPLINFLPEKVPLIEYRPRLKGWLKKCNGNCVSWCILYNVFWIMGLLHFQGSGGIMLAALVVSLATYVLIFILDALADSRYSPDYVDKEVRFWVEPLSLIIGLAWKSAFNISIITITAKVHVLPVPLETFMMALVVALVVVPAWRWYILPIVMHPEWHEHFISMVQLPTQRINNGPYAPMFRL